MVAVLQTAASRATNDAFWVQAVEFVSVKWEDLDTGIGKAIMNTSAGSICREFLSHSEARRQVGATVSVQAVAHMSFRTHYLDRGQVLHVNLMALIALEYKEDLES